MQRRTFLRWATAGSAPLIAGCGGGGTGGGTGTPTEGDTPTPTPDAVVEMVSTSFEPRRTEVSVGDTVMWENTSNYGHTVTATQFHDSAKSWSFDASTPAGASAIHTFDSEGVYEYYCTVHGKGTMCGAVLVGDATLATTLPCSESD